MGACAEHMELWSEAVSARSRYQELAAGLFNFVGLVIDPQHDFVPAKSKGLHLVVFAMLAVLSGSRDKAVPVKVNFQQQKIKRKVGPRQSFWLP